jgi:FKBP-type peptidyl-prolyl cis-trans isomerase
MNLNPKSGFAVFKTRSVYVLIVVLVGILFSLPSSSPAFADGLISLAVNGQTVQCSQPPQIIDGRALVPLRDLDDALGAQTAWNANTQQITVSTAVYNIALTIGSTALTVNGQAQTMDVAPVIIDGRTFLPARYVAEALGCQVTWDAASQTVSISNATPGSNSISNTAQSTATGQQGTTPSSAGNDQETLPRNIQGMTVQDVKEGTGKAAENGDQVTVNYVGTLTDGTVFDSSFSRNQPFSFTIGAGQVIEGWDLGVAGMKVGGERKLVIPPSLGYGATGVGPIPPNATIDFTIDLLAIN